MIVGASSKDFAKFAVFIKLERIFSLMKPLWQVRVWSRLWGKYMIHIIPALFNNISAKILLSSLKIPITDVSYLAHSFPLNSFSDSCPDSLVLTLYHCILVAKLSLPPEGQNTINPPQFHNNFNIYSKQHRKQSSVV